MSPFYERMYKFDDEQAKRKNAYRDRCADFFPLAKRSIVAFIVSAFVTVRDGEIVS